MLVLGKVDIGLDGGKGLFVVLFFFVVFLIFVREIAVLRGFFFVVLFFFIIIEVVRDEVQMHGMRLGDLKLGFALGAAQDFAFFDFVFVHVDFGGTLRATDHGSILRSNVRRAGPYRLCRRHGVLYTALC
jgi:hypothetical protein